VRVLHEERVKKLAELVFEYCCGEATSPGLPGWEYNALTRFLRTAKLNPPDINRYWDEYNWEHNYAATIEWLRAYLSELNGRQARGEYLPTGIESVILALLAHRSDATIALELERLLDPSGLGVSFDSERRQHSLFEIRWTDEDSAESIAVTIHRHLGLDDDVYDVSKTLFKDGHFRQAVLEACTVLEKAVKQRLSEVAVSAQDLYGKGLMSRALNENLPGLRINSLSNSTEKAEHEGFKLLLMGTFALIRNPPAHGRGEHNASQALEKLALISFLTKEVKAAEVVAD